MWNLGVRLRPAVESTIDECVSVTKSELTTASVVYLYRAQCSASRRFHRRCPTQTYANEAQLVGMVAFKADHEKRPFQLCKGLLC